MNTAALFVSRVMRVLTAERTAPTCGRVDGTTGVDTYNILID